MKSLKIAIMGGECAGKTTLAGVLAAALPRAVCTTEALRVWVDAAQRTPLAREQRTIMEAQIAAENASCAQAGVGIVVCDTTPLTIALASRYYFQDDSLLAEAIAHHRGYAHTLVCSPDIEWIADGLQRDGSQTRARIAQLLDDTLSQHGITPIRVHGQGAARTAQALAALQWMLES